MTANTAVDWFDMRNDSGFTHMQICYSNMAENEEFGSVFQSKGSKFAMDPSLEKEIGK